MNKTEFLENLARERAVWLGLIGGLSAEQLEAPQAVGRWSPRDVLAHVAIWLRWAAGQAAAIGRGSLPADQELYGLDLPAGVRDADESAFNEWSVEQLRSRPLAEILALESQAYTDLAAAVQQLPKEVLADPERPFASIPWKTDEPLWLILANNSIVHYQEHAEDLRGWLAAEQ
ncbi:MAG: maleylpyruvate isomerase N-terminal domain-containing protein [Candidatus Promineifilaceae bacterium]